MISFKNRLQTSLYRYKIIVQTIVTHNICARTTSAQANMKYALTYKTNVFVLVHHKGNHEAVSTIISRGWSWACFENKFNYALV